MLVNIYRLELGKILLNNFTLYSEDLNTRLVWYSKGWKEDGCQMVWFLNTRQPNHLNTRHIDTILFSYVLVWYLNGWYGTLDIVLDQPFEYQTIWNPAKILVFKWFVFRSPLYFLFLSKFTFIKSSIQKIIIPQLKAFK